VDEFGRTSLLRLAASIGSDDHWVMAASSGAITLTPLRMMSSAERQSATARSVLLRLTDLGYVDCPEDEGDAAAPSPLSNSIGVLLLPWSLQAAVARLAHLSRTSTDPIPSCYAPEDWLVTGHVFIDDGDWSAEKGTRELGPVANTLFGFPPTGRRHFMFGTLAGESGILESAPDASFQREGGELVSHANGERSAVDPLAYTNPGSVPEGLSPLFARHHGRSS
jgi:hypothetical protein